MSIKAYKGFNKDMTCKGFQFKEGETYHEDEARMCEKGFHACLDPLDCLSYYDIVNSVYHEVELDEVTEEKSEDTKICGKTIKIGAAIDIAGIVKASIDFVFKSIKDCFNKTENNNNSGDNAKIGSIGDNAKIGSIGDNAQIGSSGDYAKIGSSGYNAKIGSSGYNAKIGSSGDNAQIGSIGDNAQIGSSGDNAKIGSIGDNAKIGSSGDYAKIGSSGYNAQIGSSGYNAKIGSSGDNAKIGSSGYNAKIGSSGYNAKIGSSGYNAKIGSSGDYAQIDMQGQRSVAMCAGNNGKIRGKIGDWITLAEWAINKDGNFYPKYVKTAKITGKAIKPDTWYTLKGGKFIEVTNDEEKG